MRPDIDLEFLQNCTNADLRTLCDILIKDNEGNIRLSEKLTDTDSYYNCYPHNTKGMWQDIAAELQRFGGNTFLNFYRHGRGPAYESIVLDVCKKMEVDDINEHDTAEEMEQKLLFKLTETMISKLSEEELSQLMKELNIEKRSYKKQGVIAALLVAKAVNKKLFYKMMTYLQICIRNACRSWNHGCWSRTDCTWYTVPSRSCWMDYLRSVDSVGHSRSGISCDHSCCTTGFLYAHEVQLQIANL